VYFWVIEATWGIYLINLITMTKGQIIRAAMYRTTIAFCDENAAIVTILPEFDDNLILLKDKSQQIQTIGEQQKLDITWIVQQKNRLKAQLITLAADTARKLSAYAQLTHNTELLGEVNISERDFTRYPDGELAGYAAIIYDHAQPIVNSLAKYAITPATQTALLNAINDYNSILGDPRLGKITKSQATAQLAELFASANAVLADMDAAVKIVQLSQPIFFKGYLAARKVIKVGGTKLSVKIVVTEAGTDDPVKGVSVRIVSDSDPTIIIEKTTAAKGGINIKSMSAGNYHITFSKAGYATQTVTASVNDGEMTVVNIKLGKS
jgi:5-hydroxyisourate hydrolase-like protein (transthyretin family)